MSDFLSILLERERGQVGAIVPRVPSLYEPLERNASLAMFEAAEPSESSRADAREYLAQSHQAEHAGVVPTPHRVVPVGHDGSTPSLTTAAAPQRETTNTRAPTASNSLREAASTRDEREIETDLAPAAAANSRIDREPRPPAIAVHATTPSHAREPAIAEHAPAAPRKDLAQADPGTATGVVEPAHAAERRMLVTPLVVSATRHDETTSSRAREPAAAEHVPAAPRNDLARADPGTATGVVEPVHAAEHRVVVATPVVNIATHDDDDNMAMPVSAEVASARLLAKDSGDITPALPSHVALNAPPRREPSMPSPAPTIHVTIGRVEVRAVTAPAAPVRARATPNPMSLDEYLTQRNQRGPR